jgi:hypothetical protein
MDGISSSATMQPRELMRQAEARTIDPRVAEARTPPDAQVSQPQAEAASAVVTLSAAARSESARPGQSDSGTPESRAAAAVEGAGAAQDVQTSYPAQKAVTAYREMAQSTAAQTDSIAPGQQAPSLLRG